MSTKVRNTADDTGTDSTKNSRGDSVDLYRRYITAVRKWVDANPTMGTPEWERLRGELRAASAVSTHRWYLTRRLLDPSTNVDYTAVVLLDGRITWSVLHYAARLQSADIVNILLSSGRWTKINRRDSHGATPLMTACDSWGWGVLSPTEKDQSDRRKTVETLLRYSADIHCRDGHGRTALQIALEGGHQECAKLLLRAGSSIADLMVAQRGSAGNVIDKMIKKQARNAFKYIDMLEKHRGQSRKSDTHSPLQVPVNFLGDSGAGKSSLAASLVKGRPITVAESDRTVGAELNKVHADGINFLIYDLGGHPSYAFLHLLYLPQFGIHVVFIKVGQHFDAADCSCQLNRWMYFLSAKVSGAKVVVVVSKVDLLSDEELKEAVRVLKLKLQIMEMEECELIDTWSRNNEAALSSHLVNGKYLPGYHTIEQNIKDADAVKRLRLKVLGDILCVSCKEGYARGLKEFIDRCAGVVKNDDVSGTGEQFFKLSEFPESWENFLGKLLKCRDKARLALHVSEVRQIAAEAGVPVEDVDACLYLFEVKGNILHYDCSEQALNKYVFHDPQLLVKSMGQLVYHDLARQFKLYITSVTDLSMLEADDMRNDFKNGLVNYDLVDLQLNKNHQSGGKCSAAVVQVARHIGLCVTVDKRLSQAQRRQMIFVPSLVTRLRSEVDLKNKWGPAKMNGWDDFVMELRLHKGLPVGFVQRVIVEAAPFISGNVNFLNGFFGEGWDECLMLLEEVPESFEEFSRLRFQIRAEFSNVDAAIQNMTWLFYVLQTTLSSYPGVLGHVVTPCQCNEFSYDVQECLILSYEELKSVSCPKCPVWNRRSAAEFFPAKRFDVDPSTVYFSKFNPKDIGQFASAFGDKATQNEVASIASYLFHSSELLFGVIFLSADELFEYAEGKRRGRHLISRLKDIGVLTKMSDGCYNYNGLARILFAVGLGLLCDQLLVKQPRSLFPKKGVFEENKSEQDRHKPVHTPGQTGSKDSPGDNSITTSFHAGPPTAKTTMSQKEPADAVHAASASAVSQLQAAGTKPTTAGLTSTQTQESSRPTGVFTTQRQSQRIEEQSVKTDDRHKPGHTPGQTGSKDVPGDNPITASSPPGKTTTSQKESAEAGHTASAAAVSQSKAAGTKPTTASLTSPQAQESGAAHISASDSEEAADGGDSLEAILRDIKDQLPRTSELFRKLQETTSNDAPLKYHVPLNIFGKSEGRMALMQALTQSQEFSQIPSRSAGIPCFCSSTKDGENIFFHVYNFSDDDISCGVHRLFMWERAVNVIVIEAKDDSTKFSVMNCRNQLVSSVDDVSAKVPDAVFLVCLSKCHLLSVGELAEAVADLQDEATETVSDFKRSTKYHGNHDEENVEVPNKRDGTTGTPIIHEGLIKLAMGENGKLDSSGLHRFIDVLVRDKDGPLRCIAHSNSWDKLLSALSANRKDLPAKLCLTLAEVRQKAHENGLQDKDVFPHCLLLLKTGGFLLHYEDGRTENKLGKFVFHDIPFLIDFLRSLFKDDNAQWERYCRGKKLHTDQMELEEFKSVGLVPEEYLFRLLKNKPEASGGSIQDVVLLVSRYVGKCIKTSKKTSQNDLPLLFVPSFITCEQADLSEWSSSCDKKTSKFTLCLFLERRAMPAGWFWKVVVGIVSNDFKLISVWNSGLIAEGVRFRFLLRTDISPSVDRPNCSVSLVFELRSPKHLFGNARQDVVQFYKAVKFTMALYYPGIGYKVRVSCVGCESGYFDADECLRQTDGEPKKYTQCECGRLASHMFPRERLCNDGDKFGIYVAKDSSESIGVFAQKFKRKVAHTDINDLAELLCADGEQLFGQVIVTPDEKLSGSELIMRLKDKGVISDIAGTLYYDGLVTILERMGLYGLVNDLFGNREALEYSRDAQ